MMTRRKLKSEMINSGCSVVFRHAFVCHSASRESKSLRLNNDSESPSVTNNSYTSLKQPGNNCGESGNPVSAAPFWVVFCRQWEEQRDGDGEELVWGQRTDSTLQGMAWWMASEVSAVPTTSTLRSVCPLPCCIQRQEEEELLLPPSLSSSPALGITWGPLQWKQICFCKGNVFFGIINLAGGRICTSRYNLFSDAERFYSFIWSKMSVIDVISNTFDKEQLQKWPLYVY